MKPRWYRSARFWLSAITAVLVAAAVIAAWPRMLSAFHSLSAVDPWILALLVPLQLASFAVTGEVLFSYLRARGELSGVRPLAAMRMSLEFNFANHMLPSGGAAGITYTSWKLSTLGVPASKGTVAQLARLAVTFASFTVVIAVAAGWLIAAGHGEPVLLWAAAAMAGLAIGTTAAGVLLMRDRRRLHRLAGCLARVANAVGTRIGRPRLVEPLALVRFFDGLHRELRAIIAQPRTLRAPFLWSFLVHALDAGLFWVALAAFGLYADPALVLVAYGAATVASIVVVTPNGIGAYELVLIGLLVSGGLPDAGVIAAVLLARAILLLGTIVFGWAFYQLSVAKGARATAA